MDLTPIQKMDPSPVIELNRAVAVAMRDGPEAGLALIDAILARGDLENYHLAHAARADLYRRLGRAAEARASYKRALDLTRQEPERRFLKRRLAELSRYGIALSISAFAERLLSEPGRQIEIKGDSIMTTSNVEHLEQRRRS